MIICLETATNLCSVAFCSPEGVIALKESNADKSHASVLTVFIDEILKENGIRAADLDAIAVSKGPGSYTGLRIGVSAAKGIAFAANIPLIGIDTTFSMFWGLTEKQFIRQSTDKDTLFCPMLDARRMEVYYAVYDAMGNTVRKISAEVITESFLADIPASHKIVFFGDGALKGKDLIRRENIQFEEDFAISAASMLKPAYQAFSDGNFEDVAYFEPFYLKDFITTTQRKNIF